MDVQILSGGDADNVRPDLEQCRVTRPDGIMEENLGGDEGAVVWVEGRDESLGEGGVGRRGRSFRLCRACDTVTQSVMGRMPMGRGRGGGEKQHSNKVEACGGDAVEDGIGRGVFQAFGDHGLSAEGPVDARPCDYFASES